MNQQTMITICEARPSQSGKTLGIKDQQGRWYTTKHWDLQNMVGQAIYAETSTSEFNGKPMHWINEYNRPDGHSQPMANVQGPSTPAQGITSGAGPGMGSQQPPMPNVALHNQNKPVPPSVDRDASIVAQTLSKCVTYSSPQEAFEGYSWLYDKYILWSKASPVFKVGNSTPNMQGEEQQVQQAQQQSENPAPFDDGIPF